MTSNLFLWFLYVVFTLMKMSRRDMGRNPGLRVEYSLNVVFTRREMGLPGLTVDSSFNVVFILKLPADSTPTQ